MAWNVPAHDNGSQRAPARRGATREGEKHDAAGISALFDQPRNAMGQRRCLAGPGAGNDQERPGIGGRKAAVFDGAPLLRIEFVQVCQGQDFDSSRLRIIKRPKPD
jgi:hypothetical protein